MTRIVNRVPTLHRPLPEDASFADIITYWQRRIPTVDMTAIAHDALNQTFEILCTSLGLDPKPFDAWLTKEAQQ